MFTGFGKPHSTACQAAGSLAARPGGALCARPVPSSADSLIVSSGTAGESSEERKSIGLTMKSKLFSLLCDRQAHGREERSKLVSGCLGERAPPCSPTGRGGLLRLLSHAGRETARKSAARDARRAKNRRQTFNFIHNTRNPLSRLGTPKSFI